MALRNLSVTDFGTNPRLELIRGGDDVRGSRYIVAVDYNCIPMPAGSYFNSACGVLAEIQRDSVLVQSRFYLTQQPAIGGHDQAL